MDTDLLKTSYANDTFEEYFLNFEFSGDRGLETRSSINMYRYGGSFLIGISKLYLLLYAIITYAMGSYMCNDRVEI